MLFLFFFGFQSMVLAKRFCETMNFLHCQLTDLLGRVFHFMSWTSRYLNWFTNIKFWHLTAGLRETPLNYTNNMTTKAMVLMPTNAHRMSFSHISSFVIIIIWQITKPWNEHPFNFCSVSKQTNNMKKTKRSTLIRVEWAIVDDSLQMTCVSSSFRPKVLSISLFYMS